MLIETKYLGKMEINEDKVIHFETGLPGFPDETKFAVLDIPQNDLLQILQSTTTPELAFIVTNPHQFFKDYEFQLDEHVLGNLQIDNENEIVILAIMTIHDPFHFSTINLQAPLIINSKSKRAKQFILPHEKFEMKAKISFPATKEKGV